MSIEYEKPFVPNQESLNVIPACSYCCNPTLTSVVHSFARIDIHIPFIYQMFIRFVHLVVTVSQTKDQKNGQVNKANVKIQIA